MNTLEHYITKNDTHNNNQYNNTILNIKHVKNSTQYPYDESIIKDYILYQPYNLDLTQLLKDAGEYYWLKHIWKLHYILTVIYKGRWSDKYKDYDYTLINVKILRLVVGDKFATKALRLLCRLKVIQTDRHYIKGKKSKGYKFAPQYDVYFNQIDTEDGQNIPQRVLTRIPRVNCNSSEHAFLFENLRKVTLDESVNCFFDTFQAKSLRQADYYERSVELIRTQDWSFFYDRITGRVFNNVTALPRRLRQFMLLDGQPVIEIDVANCQPLLLISLYDKCDEAERNEFKEVVESGVFYEMLNDLLKKPYGDRDKLKDAFYRRMFGTKKQKRYKLYKAFAARFPKLEKNIDIIKTPRHEALAVRLQTLEAELIINGVVRTVANTTKIPILTIHDSIITLPHHENEVRELIQHQFRDKLDLIPLLKVKNRHLITPSDLLLAA